MADDTQDLRRRIESLADEDLTAMLARQKEYTPTALEIAQAEADRRGGLAHLERELSGREPETHQSSALASRLVQCLRRTGSWLIPARDRFERSRVLRMTVSLLRIISALAGLAAGIGVVGAVFEVVSGSGLGPAVFEVASGSDPGPGLFPMTLLIMNGLIALVACLSLQAVVLAIVDTERNTRETNRLLREWKDGSTEG